MSDLSDTNLSVEDATTVNNNRVAVEALVEKKEREGGKYQKELVYNNYLPYSQLLDNESGKQTGDTGCRIARRCKHKCFCMIIL